MEILCIKGFFGNLYAWDEIWCFLNIIAEFTCSKVAAQVSHEWAFPSRKLIFMNSASLWGGFY